VHWWCSVDGVIFFFFQAEDGIRDATVTGVQTCALPISVDGIATFSGLWIDKVGTGYVLGAASASLAGATSAAFDIAPAAAARLEIGRASCRERAGGSEAGGPWQ